MLQNIFDLLVNSQTCFNLSRWPSSGDGQQLRLQYVATLINK